VNNDDVTLSTPLSPPAEQPEPLLGLTILWHPDAERVGQQCVGPAAAGTLELHRYAPLFRAAGQPGAALGHRCVARAPLLIHHQPGQRLRLTLPASTMAVSIDGVRVDGAVAELSHQQVARGVVLALGAHILLCLHWMDGLPGHDALPGVLGVGSAAAALRRQIRQVAQTDLPVLLLGETGTGKDVAARAIHDGGARREQPFIAVNMATLAESLAAADLFGAVKGAYTGALQTRAGLFAEAAGGTLFLDEIGDTPASVQPMLLRVLENGEYRSLGAQRDQRSSARLMAATDQDLGARSFNQALLRRMEAYVIRLPALRERREDIGVLLQHFLRHWEAQSGHPVRLPAALVGELCIEDWPGNIRQLGHVVRRAAMALAAGETPLLAALLPPAAARSMAPTSAPSSAASAARPKSARAKLSELSGQDIVDAMERNGWRIQSAARSLGISRPSLYKLLEAHPQIRRVEAIPLDEIRQALRQHAADLAKCASALRTPGEALRRHLRLLGLVA
jgi:two-component system nitrogen regulation response regulator GlnG